MISKKNSAPIFDPNFLVCNSSSSVLALDTTSPSLLHTFVAYTTQLSIAIRHNGNSYLHQHIPRKRLRASSCCDIMWQNVRSVG